METYVNDTVKLTIDTDIDVSGYSTLLIKYKRPGGITGCWTAGPCPADIKCITYTCVHGDLDINGEWIFQGQVKDVGVKLTSIWFKLDVHPELVEFCTTVPPTTMVPTT